MEIVPDQVYRIPIADGELLLSPAYDILHYFPGLAAFILKYWNQEDGGICDIHLPEESAQFLKDECGILVIERNSITEFEFDKLISWRVSNLSDDILDVTD